MPLVRIRHGGRPTLGVLRHAATAEVTPLPQSLAELLAMPLASAQAAVEQTTGPAVPFVPADVLPPVDEQEVWAAGVTYRRSRDGRIEESGNETLYDHVYASARPEIFLKATPTRVVTDGQPVGIRADSSWDVPEAEIGLVINASGEIAGYLAGNDMSSRSIEGENALYLPQAKMYEASCALSASITPVWEAPPLPLRVSVTISRGAETVYTAQTSSDAMHRPFDELVTWLMLALPMPAGAVLLTGTGLVPGADVTVEPGDVVTVGVDGVATLVNPVIRVGSPAPV
jgi:2-dehydro-3-deoxy-D-arabinonate dehydratase